jgi:hypothetical protein
MLLDLLWPLVVVAFVACVFVLIVNFVGYAVHEHDAAAPGTVDTLAPTHAGGAEAPA